jgi:hypothetical protein
VANYALFIEEGSGASLLVNADLVRVVREESRRGLEPASRIVFDENHSVMVKSDLRSVWGALLDAQRP